LTTGFIISPRRPRNPNRHQRLEAVKRASIRDERAGVTARSFALGCFQHAGSCIKGKGGGPRELIAYQTSVRSTGPAVSGMLAAPKRETPPPNPEGHCAPEGEAGAESVVYFEGREDDASGVLSAVEGSRAMIEAAAAIPTPPRHRLSALHTQQWPKNRLSFRIILPCRVNRSNRRRRCTAAFSRSDENLFSLFGIFALRATRRLPSVDAVYVEEREWIPQPARFSRCNSHVRATCWANAPELRKSFGRVPADRFSADRQSLRQDQYTIAPALLPRDRNQMEK
jgi:hypothetical protein